MKKQMVVLALCMTALLGACTRSLSPEEQARVEALRTELEATKREVAGAEAQNAQYSGGLVKALLSVRLELLKTNEALIEQRIHAIESGAKVTIETVATNPDVARANQLQDDIAKQEAKVTEADAKASLYSGGLVGAMAVMGAATERNTLAMLRQQYLVAKYGLAYPKQGAVLSVASPPSVAADETAGGVDATATSEDADRQVREQILEAALLRKQYAKQDYQDYVFFDITFNAKGLDKPARAIKGVLTFMDLFNEPKFALKWTIDKPISPGASYTERGSGFEYNQFKDDHQWVRNTEKDNMKIKFRVDSILYQDGTTRTFD
ncbi:hypothetical protein E4T66_14905 [Sinimarinibacterium sp. CAU 1509]|uniref:hypothetical protein n=1 Tax=Sinimarinibacterium sp. CAU 1509 TaxID=2562283 RepID=UPI0010AD0558|nr:hypothetical protein [Sinimarinibacterium sp. CAU 1509]TJY58885.1 hypothetical protein E4T66_14905 [Sinimarinibacterium sp. CAU 1509]